MSCIMPKAKVNMPGLKVIYVTLEVTNVREVTKVRFLQVKLFDNLCAKLQCI
jgi:hypothetical protein